MESNLISRCIPHCQQRGSSVISVDVSSAIYIKGVLQTLIILLYALHRLFLWGGRLFKVTYSTPTRLFNAKSKAVLTN